MRFQASLAAANPARADFDSVYQDVEPFTLASREKLRAIWDLLVSTKRIPGDLAELGVYRGGVTKLMAVACPSRKVFAFDTFTGMPTTGRESGEWHTPGQFSDVGDVRQRLKVHSNVKCLAGVFPQSANGLERCQFALVHLDADWHSSTFEGLRWFWPRLVVGGLIVLDDWGWPYCPGVLSAVRKYFDNRHDASFCIRAPNQLTIKKRVRYLRYRRCKSWKQTTSR